MKIEADGPHARTGVCAVVRQVLDATRSLDGSLRVDVRETGEILNRCGKERE